ncbi:MAG: hypothetical protein ACTS6G_00630 [Candidatus Hodgkinia cicadicola]
MFDRIARYEFIRNWGASKEIGSPTLLNCCSLCYACLLLTSVRAINISLRPVILIVEASNVWLAKLNGKDFSLRALTI